MQNRPLISKCIFEKFIAQHAIAITYHFTGSELALCLEKVKIEEYEDDFEGVYL